MQPTRSFQVKESYPNFIIPAVQMTVFSMMIQNNFLSVVENFDNIINCIKDCFDQRDYQIYVPLLKNKTGKIIMQIYGVNEFDVPSLKTQLLLFPERAKLYGLNSRTQILEMIALFRKLDTIKNKMLVAEVIKLVKLILMMPATNAVSQKSFSSLKRIKTYLCSATKNNWLNHLLIQHVHKLSTDQLDLTKVSDDFVERREGRKSMFGLWYCTALSFVSLFRRTCTLRIFLQ